MIKRITSSAGLVLAGALLLGGTAHAQVAQEWVQSYDDELHANDYAGPTAVDADGNLVVTGQACGQEHGIHTLKYGPGGDRIWERHATISIAAAPTAMVVDDARRITIVGYAYTGWVNSGNQYAVVQYDSDGDLLWHAGYDAGGGPTDDIAYAVAVDDFGCVYVTGAGYAQDHSVIATLKFDADGLRSSTWPDVGQGLGVRQYAIAGQAGEQTGLGVAVDGDGNVYVTGASALASGVATDFVTVRYDAAGNERWVRRYDGPAAAEDRPVAVDLDAAGNVYVAGTSAAPNQSGATRPDYATIKYDPDGNQQWIDRFDGAANYEDRCKALVVDDAGNAYVTGSASCGSTSTDFATIKYDTNGHRLWLALYDGGHGADDATALAVDADGCVYVTGTISTAVPFSDIATVKFSASGQQCWDIAYAGPDLYGDRPTGVALDGAGKIYVHGTSGTASCWDDYVTIKYSQATPVPDTAPPAACALGPVSPNPFNPATTIAFTVAGEGRVTLAVFDLAGREVATLVNEVLPAGQHRRTFLADGLPSGAYLCRLQAGGATATRKLLLVR